MYNSKIFKLILIIISFLFTGKVLQNIIQNEHFGYIKRINQTTYRRRTWRARGESARVG